MTNINYLLVVVAIGLLAIGTFGFLRKAWGIQIYAYFFVIVSIAMFVFAIMPAVFPNASTGRQIFTVLVPGAGSVVVVYVLLKMIEKRRK